MKRPLRETPTPGSAAAPIASPTSAPTGARRRRKEWMNRPERSTTSAIKFIVWVALSLGRPAARLLLYPICLYFVLLSRKPRKASARFLARALGRPPGLGDLFRHYHVFAACLLDRVFFLNDQSGDFDIRVHGEDVVIDVMERGEGCLLLGAHMGSFEAIRMLGHRQRNLRVSLVMYEENARKINSVLNAINPSLSLEVIGLGRPESMLRVRERLDQGHFVGMLADRTLDGEAEIRLPFLGEPAAFALGPFQLAAMLKRPVVLMMGIYRGGRRYDVHFERIADFSDVPTQDRPARDRPSQDRPSQDRPSQDRPGLVRWAAGRYADRLEHYARSFPYNWFNFYDFWK